MIIGPPPKFHGTREILSGEVVRTLGVKGSQVQILSARQEEMAAVRKYLTS